MAISNSFLKVALLTGGSWYLPENNRSEHTCRLEACTLRVKFLETCLKSDIIPKFLKFRIPNNGCFDDRSVTDFQRRLLRKEIVTAKTSYSSITNIVDEKRSALITSVRDELLPSVALYSRIERKAFRKDSEGTHAKKLENLSSEQDRPLLNVSNTVITYNLNYSLPKFLFNPPILLGLARSKT